MAVDQQALAAKLKRVTAFGYEAKSCHQQAKAEQPSRAAVPLATGAGEDHTRRS